jgi:hypothetical protein
VRAALTLLLLGEAILTGAWLARLLVMLPAYGWTTLAVIGLRVLVALGQVVASVRLSRDERAGARLATWVFVASAILLSLELGARLRPSSVFPAHRWVVVAIYAAYAVVGVAMALRVRSRSA